MEIAPADLANIRELYTQGRYRQAHEAASAFGPIRSWTSTPARLIGGRLAIQLGAPTLGRQLHLAAYRSTPHHPEAIYYHARYRLERFGPLAAWRFLRANPDWSDAPPELHADWLALNGFVAARLRDFDRSERWLNKAETVAPERAWPCIERASSYELADRLEDALASAQRSLQIQPWFRPGVQATAHTLVRLGREHEALDLLTEASSHIESGLVLAQLAGLQNDLGHHADAMTTLHRYAELTPLMDKEVAKWQAARLADTAYLMGDFTPAAIHAREVKEAFYTRFADRLTPADSAVPGRWVLPVDLGFEKTPNTVYELLARFWKQPVPAANAEALPPADALPDVSERLRFERAGWHAVEFALTPETAFDLASRGVPFLVTLVEAGYAQPRLVVAADRLKNTVSLVDGSERKPVEAPLDTMQERFAFAGPRALVVLPASEVTRLEGFAPPDRELHEQLHAIQKSLLAHDRVTAQATLEPLKTSYSGHRLAKLGELALARYDAHTVRLLRAYDALLTDFPHERTWVLAKASVLRELHRLPERLALLEAESEDLDAEPMVLQSLAQMLLPVHNRQDEAERLLRRSIRTRPGAAAGYYLLATQWWESRRFEDAAEVYRFACTLDDREEQFAEAYFRAARATEQVPEALRLFQQRAGRAAVPTPSAARALYQALMDRDEPEQATAALDQAIRKLQEAGSSTKKKDAEQALGDLLLFRAECHAGAGRFGAADADLASARGIVTPLIWHRAAARIARIKPDLAAAVLHFLEVVKLDPLTPDAHRTLTALLADTDGRSAARTHLGQIVQRFPHAYALQKLRAEFLSGDPDADANAVIQEMLDDCPEDAWALRQRALILADRKQHEEALAAIRQAGDAEPGHPWYYGVLAQVHHRADRQEEAAEACREALRANIDQDSVIAELMQLSRGREEKQEALQFITEQLEQQPHTGEGLIAFVGQSHQTATEIEDHQDLLEFLERTCDDRPDLWHVWSALIQQLAGMNRLEEANELAKEATVRFPLLSKLWLDLAQVCQAMGNPEGRLEALRQAVDVSPVWSIAARELAEALEEVGEPDDAVTVLERTAARSPLDPFAHGFLSEQMWEAGQSREALDRAKRAVRLEPGYDWAWHAIQVWADRLEVPDEPAELARELCRERTGDPRVWLRLARLLHHPRHNDEVLGALDQAVTLEPKNIEAHDLKAERLAEAGRFEEALAAAQPQELAGELPFVLQGRLAWVEAKRGNYASAIPPMQALVAVDPTYVWGWHQLAEWYNETGRPQGYLEAASELVRLQPGHPVAMMMRGEAKLQTGDRDSGKADLRDALKASPGFSPAAAVLFEAHLADDEFREARQILGVLQEHAVGPEVSLRQVQLSCRTGEVESAVRAFAEICEGPGQSPQPIQSALTEMQNAEWEDKAMRVLRESWQSGGPFHPWAPLFWVESDDGRDAEPGERLRAADAAIKGYPKFLPGHDCKAEQLALTGRFEEAFAACKPAEFGDPPPIELRARIAWIEARRGDRAKATNLMKQVVAEEPTFVLGWRQLAAWYDAAGRHRECLEAADRFVQLEPENPVAHVYRGEAKRNVGDRRGALADFQKAMELDPAFEAAGISLIGEQLATGDIDGAARSLANVQIHTDGPLVRLRAVQVACRLGDSELARERFRDLCTDSDVSRGVLRDAVNAFDSEGWGPKLTVDLKELAFTDGATPDVAGLWAERLVEAGSIDAVADRLPELLSHDPEAGREAVLAYTRALALAGKPVQGAVQKYSEVLRADDASWARAAEILVAAGNHALAVAWLADWRERGDLEAWMLRPLTVALRALDQDEKAIEVCRAAVRIGSPEEQLSEFRTWLALDFALSGQAEEAGAQLGRVEAAALPPGTRLVHVLTEAVLMVTRAGPGGKSAAFAEAREHVKTTANSVPSRDVPAGANRAYRRVVTRLASEAGTLNARLWALWQRVAPWVK